jgi:hypothetical protein
MTLWANLHGSFTLGVALALPLALDAVLTHPRATRRQAARSWGLFCVLTLAASLFTPAGWHGYAFLFEVSRMTNTLTWTIEWRSPNFQRPQLLEVWLLLILFLTASGRLRLPWLRLLLVLGFIHLALQHARHISILGLVTPFLIAAPLTQQRRLSPSSGQDIQALDRFFVALAAPAKTLTLAVVGLIGVAAIMGFLHSSKAAPIADFTPDVALAAAKSAGVRGPVFNSFEFGGYLIYRGIPVFIDGRTPVFGDALVKRYLDATQFVHSEEFPRLLDEYKIGWTLMVPETPALVLLDKLPGWRRVYSDTTAVVHMRDESLPQQQSHARPPSGVAPTSAVTSPR